MTAWNKKKKKHKLYSPFLQPGRSGLAMLRGVEKPEAAQ